MVGKRLHYGWIVTIGCGIMLFYSIGFGINCFSVFIAPLIDALGLTKTEGSSIASLQNIGSLCSMVLTGPLINRFGARRVAFIAGLFMAAGYFFFSFAHILSACYFASIIVGMGYGSGSMIPVSILMTEWFDEKRGFALGVAAAGSGISTIIYPPIIAIVIEKYGVSAGFQFNSLNVILLATITVILVRNKPSDVGQLPYGMGSADERGDRQQTDETDEEGTMLRDALKAKRYYMALFALIVLGLTIQPTIAHISTLFTSKGYDAVFSASMVSLYGVTMIVSKPLYGAIIDKFGVKSSNGYIYFFWILGLASALLIGRIQIIPYFFAILVGMGAPVSTMGLPIWAAKLFGKKDLSNIYPTFKIAFTIGGSLGLTLPGLMADLTGSYVSVFWIYIALSLLSFVVVRRIFT